jgi:aerobic carbon-monoxide dehydrogenase small subunit
MVAERRVEIRVNGSLVVRYVEPRMLLVHFLRSCQGLTSTRVGCDTSSCGACTVLLDGANVKSCTIFAVQADGRSVTTLEGLTGPDGQLSPIQEAFRSEHGLQCGYCTPGIIMAAYPYVTQGVDDPDDDEIREVISGNLCRCTGYTNVVAAIRAAVRAYASRTPEH